MAASVLVLGGEGFLGLNIRQELRGKYHCVSVDLKPSFFTGPTRHLITIDPYTASIKGKYETVIHLIDHNVPPERFEKAEQRLMENILRVGARHLIVFSSAVVCADPSSGYGQRKLLLERMYTEFCGLHKIKLTTVRLFNAYGPYQLPDRPGSLVANLLCNYLAGTATVIHDKQARRDFMYVGDVSRIIRYMVDHAPSGTFDVGTGTLVAIEELMRIIEERVIHNRLIIRDDLQKETIVCPPATHRLECGVAVTTLLEGLTRSYGFYKDANIAVL